MDSKQSFDKLKTMGMSQDNLQQWQRDNKTILDDFHRQAQDFASSQNRTYNITDFYQPGTPRFDSLFNDIVSRKIIPSRMVQNFSTSQLCFMFMANTNFLLNSLKS